MFGKWEGFFPTYMSSETRFHSLQKHENKTINTAFSLRHLWLKQLSQIFGNCVCSSFILADKVREDK